MKNGFMKLQCIDAWRRSAGLPEPVVPELGSIPPLSVLQRTEWDSEFEQLMRNRLIMGGIRYGLLGSAKKRTYDNPSSMKKRLDLYIETGNAEHLVDIANLCLVEFNAERHPDFHFEAQDDKNHVEK